MTGGCRLCDFEASGKALMFWEPPLTKYELCRKHREDWENEDSDEPDIATYRVEKAKAP